MGVEFSLWDYLVPTLILSGALVVGLVGRRYLFHYLHKWAQHTHWEFDNVVIQATRGPFVLWVVALGIYLALEFSRLPDELVALLGKILLALVVLSMTLVLANIISAIFQRMVARGEVEAPATSLTRTFIKAGVIIVGILVLLSTLGISITPILTAFGIGGLAIALALQDTLTNLFAGFNVSMAKQVRVGDYIKLDTGQEGYVTDINWRTTSIRDFSNNLIVIPNSKLAQSIITNYYMPDKPVTIRIPVSVSYNSDPEHVERVLLELGSQALAEMPQLDPSFAPVVRLTNMGEFSLNFLLVVRAKTFDDQFSAQHELLKRILKRLREEQIEIPFPARTVYLREVGASSNLPLQSPASEWD
ncbi:MAG: mechanosensitive ion channel [Candidatus Bipolaricaulota bacterium]|nr:mechanosensitive ion channel [Candidatus Bipolaricaulota bacterium]